MRSGVAAVFLFVLGLAIGCTQTPNGLSDSFHKSGRQAYEALQRLTEYVDAGNLLYDPRYLDAQKALADADHARQTKEDTEAYTVLFTTLARIRMQRTSSDITAEAEKFLILSKGDSQPNGAEIRKAEEEVTRTEASERDNRSRLDICLAEAALYFDRVSSSSAKKGQCSDPLAK